MLDRPSQLRLLESGPKYLVRLEHNETGFARRVGANAHGMVVGARFDAPHWPDSASALRGLDGSELKRAVLAARPELLLIDPDTWLLPFLAGHDDRSLGRAAAMDCAQVVPLPLRPEHLLADRALLVAFVRAVLRSQADATFPIAPYFLFESADDPWLEVNLRCLEVTRALLGDQPFAAAMYVPLNAIEDETLAVAAGRYAARMPQASTLLLTVCDLRADLAPVTLGAYLGCVAMLASLGLRVLSDRPSEFGPAAIPFGAQGVVLGTRLYRSARANPHWERDFNPKISTRYLVAARGRRVRVEAAQKWVQKGKVRPCRIRSCKALATGRPADLRIHNAHEMRDALAHAREVGASGLVSEWRASGLVQMERWAEAVESADQRRKEA